MLQQAGHLDRSDRGPPRVLRTARATSDSYLAAVRCTVAVHSRRMGHYGIYTYIYIHTYMRGVWTGGGYNTVYYI